ncbi:TonB-dependent receptor [uncultured Sphingomonas sp.]|uniref:TonB-dependent receptor n=1 Tax=uncultured Sphingomonas sp. TaxID=158754 RepID=UPI0025DB1B09|nr:TonB-dependent receptor [uncultured Sphingomonas sp.]
MNARWTIGAGLLLAAPLPATVPTVDLPAGKLGAAVTALGRQTGTSISVEGAAIWSRPVPALRGRLTARQALQRLATISGAEVRAAGPGAWRLVTARPHAPPPARPPHASLPTEADDTPLEIVVTATKREVPLRDYAGLASFLGGSDLSLGGVSGTDAILARLATVSSTHLGAGRNKLFIRGIADSSFTGPTQATVGQYLGDLRLSYNAPDPDLRLYDMAAVEVLEGPQGTLYGAGSLGGIIRVTPNAPATGAIAGTIASGVSATQHGDPGADLAAMLNLPLDHDRAGLRVTGYGVTDGGYIDNPVRGKRDINRTDVWGGRATLRLVAGDGWTVDLGLVGQRTHGRDSQYADNGERPLTRASPIDQGFDADYTLGHVVIAKDWSDMHLRSTTGYIRQTLTETYDATVPAGGIAAGAGFNGIFAATPLVARAISDGQPQSFVQRNRTRLFAHETRLWRTSEGGIGWLLGGSITSNRTRLGRTVGAPDTPLPITGVANRIAEGTVYGEASARPVAGLTVTAGARVTHSRLSGEGEDVAPLIAAARRAVAADRTVTTLLPSGSISAAVLPRLTLFARYQEGFRPGGLAIESDFVRRFDSDHVATLESGLRIGQPGERLDLAASISHTRWRDIQADFIDGSGLPSTANIGDGRIWTVTATGGWRPIPALRLELSGTVNDSRVLSPSPAFSVALTRRSRVPNVARFAGRAGFDWQQPLANDLSLRVTGWARYVGRSRLGVGPVLGEEQGDYLDTAVIARLGTPGLGVTATLTNLTDSIGNRFALGTPFAIGARQITPLRPRTLRIGIDAAF